MFGPLPNWKLVCDRTDLAGALVAQAVKALGY